MRGGIGNEGTASGGCPDPGYIGGYRPLSGTYGWYWGQGVYAADENWPWSDIDGITFPWSDDFRQSSWDNTKIVRKDWWETRFVDYWGWSSEPRVTGTPPGDWPAPPGRSGLGVSLTPEAVFQFGQVVGDYALDLDGDGRFDQLVFEVEVNTRQSGDYWIRGTLAGGFAEAYVNVYLEKGRHTIGLPFDGMDIYMGKVDGPYLLEGLWATDVENPGPADFAENELAYAQPAYKTSLYRFSDFGVAGATLSGDYHHYVVDTGDDGYADGLVVETGLDIEKVGTYTVQGVLYDGRDEMISEATWTGPGPKVTLQFDGLRDTVGPYTLQHLHVRNADRRVTDGIKEPYPIGEVPELSARPVLLGVESAVPLDPSQPSRLVIIDGYSDTRVDTDSDGRFDQLVITVNMEIGPGEGGQAYRIEGWLLDQNGNFVSWTISDPHVLAEGVRSLPLTFDGRIINEHGVDGPLTLVALKALPGGTYSVLDEVDVAYTTSPYDHDEFEEAAVPPAGSIFKDDMESGTSQWTAESVWSLNNSVWHSYSHAWKADASGSQGGSLTTIPLDISNCGAAPTLRLRTCYDMQSPSDVGYLEVSNNGVGWTKVVTYTNSTPHWSNELIDLSDFGEMPDLHLRFNADSQNGLLWYVDDVYVNGWPAIGNNSPNEPSNPSPAHDATDQPLTVDLSWTGGDPDGDNVTYDVYFEANNSSPEVLVSDDQTGTTFDPGNLECGTDYYWMIVAQDEHEATASGGVFHFTTQACSPPVAPTDLGAATVSRTQIDLTWQDNSSDESDFRVERSPDGVSDWAEVATVGADVTGYSDTGLDCGTAYYYRVRAYRDGDGQYSGYSNVANETTQTCPSPGAPSDLSAMSASYTQIDLTWQDNSSDESEFHIERSPDGVSDWAEVATVGAGVTGYSDTGLSCSTTYYYRVRAYRDGDGQYSGYSNVAGGTTQTCPPPAAPSDLNGTVASHTQIDLTWQDNSSDESDFHIERSPNGVSGWVEVATVGTDVTGYSDTGLNCDTIYYYRVRAYRDGDGQYSGYSNIADETTLSCSGTVASFPFYDGFESGTLGIGWVPYTDNEGRVQVSPSYPYTGSYSLLLDDATSNSAYSYASAALLIDLSGQSDVVLDFWWREFSDEDHFDDGVFISDDYGSTWHGVFSFNVGPSSWRNDVVDIGVAAAANGLTLNDHFLIKFQFYDNRPIDLDGYAIDEVAVEVSPPQCYSLSTSVNPGGSGSVAVSPAPNCAYERYVVGTQVQLTANPASGHDFSDWSGGASGSANPITITMDEDRSVIANFCALPAVPSLSSPADGSSTSDTTPYFDWSSVSGATLYHIQVDDNSSFSSPEIDTTTSDSDYTPESPLSPDTHYYWHVQASNACGTRSWSAVWAFTTPAPAPAPAPSGSRIYLPIVANNRTPSVPDLVVERLIATSSSVQIVVKNQGGLPVTGEFWVDLYVDPDPVPTRVNQVWNDLCDEGLVWGVTVDALPLGPGGVITLTVGDDYYWPALSHISWPLLAGTPLYAQVDSANADTTYGAVLEGHEIVGGVYNNISGPAYPTGSTGGFQRERDRPSWVVIRPLISPPAQATRRQ